MALSHKTRIFTSDMTGAPVMGVAAGGIINVLDACLVNGFNSKTLTSLVVSGGIATATVSGGHGFTQYAVVAISGATPSGLNGSHRVATVPGSTTFTFDATGISNATATGTITAIVEDAGWTKAFTGTNKAAYNSATSDSGFYFRIDDSGAYSVGQPVRGYEAMTDVDTGTRAFPTVAQQANFATRRSTDASGDRVWVLVADDKFFYLFIRLAAVAERHQAIYFGDIASFDPAEANACVISAVNIATPSVGIFSPFYSSSNTTGNKYISSALGEYANGSVACGVYSPQIDSSCLFINQTNYPANTAPNAGLVIHRSGIVMEKTASANAVRGMIPGYYPSPIKKDNFITSGSHTISLVDGNPFLLVNSNGNASNDNLIAIDLGDWR